MYVYACTDVGCYVAVPPSYLRKPLLLRYRILSGTCTDSCCYVTWPSIVHAQTIDATLYGVIRSSLLLPQTLDVTLQDLLLYLHTCTDAWAWCYVKTCSRTCTDTWCYVTGCWATGEGDAGGITGLGDHTIAGGGTGPQTGTIYIYIYISISLYIYCLI